MSQSALGNVFEDVFQNLNKAAEASLKMQQEVLEKASGMSREQASQKLMESLEKDLEIAAMEGVMADMLEVNGMPGILGTEVLRYTDVTLTMAKDAITLTELAA